MNCYEKKISLRWRKNANITLLKPPSTMRGRCRNRQQRVRRMLARTKVSNFYCLEEMGRHEWFRKTKMVSLNLDLFQWDV